MPVVYTGDVMIRLPTLRQLSLIILIIEEYIRTAEPVSSRAVAQSGSFDIRSATIRNEMAELEDMGYLEQLHTSGGRVPTARAYRLYVDNLLKQEGINISHAYRQRIKDALSEIDIEDPEAINKTLAKFVGQLSGTLVIANISAREDAYKFGLSNLFTLPEFRELHRITGMTQFFDQFDTMFDLLSRQLWNGSSQRESEVKIMIGTENADKRIQDETMICARYRLPGGNEGSLTLVGPMRMDYRKNIGLILYAARTANSIVH